MAVITPDSDCDRRKRTGTDAIREPLKRARSRISFELRHPANQGRPNLLALILRSQDCPDRLAPYMPVMDAPAFGTRRR
jgi:hypothetical protein